MRKRVSTYGRSSNSIGHLNMKQTVSPNRSRPVAQAMSLLQKSVNQYGTFLQKLLGGYSMEVHIGTHSTVALFAPNGEIIAAQTSGGQRIELHMETEEKFMGESTMVYLKAYRAARAEIEAAAQAPRSSLLWVQWICWHSTPYQLKQGFLSAKRSCFQC